MIDVLYIRAQGQGWGPIDELAHLCARVMNGKLLAAEDAGEVSVLRKVAGQLPRRRGRRSSLLVIAPNPAHLAYAARIRQWLPGYRATAGWVIDSFWTDRIPRITRGARHFDHLFITDRDLLDEWRRSTGAVVHWAPWGTDALAVDPACTNRPVDLVRVGRQPEAWQDDDRTRDAAERLGLTFEGRPPFDTDSSVNQANLRAALQRSKFVLAFSNAVSPSSYTHPTREYLTGRWTDALAAGTAIAGVAPASASYTLWPGATVEIDPMNLARGLEQVKSAVAAWTEETPPALQSQAQATLDWRLRLRDIAAVLSDDPLPVLEQELAMLRARAAGG